MPSSSPAPGSFSLFPSPNTSRPPPVGRNQTPLGRRSESRERRAPTPQSVRAQTPQHGAAPEQAASPPRQGRAGVQHLRQQTPLLFDSPQQQQQQDPRQQWPLGGQRETQPQEQAQQQQETPPRTDTITPVATQERPIRSSIAKLPLDDGTESSNPQSLRSIFPTYNPDLPLDQQDYAPTQKSPSRIPRAILSRQSYHQRDGDSTHIRSPAHSLRGNEEAPHRWARPKPQEPPVIPKPTTTEHLKSFWKVANGWRAPSSEGRVYCMKLSQEKDAPVYTLSSATDPFYNIRLDPTSASARVTVMRHDPNKPFKEPRREAGSSSSSLIGGSSSESASASKITDGKDWHEALTTTLEEESRRHQPEDGLVALLMPTAATKVAVERANDPQAVEMAERECARLVWDDDSDNYFLVHPALATPFCVTIERSPAWSRVEYTLEHHESPLHLAKLTRDAAGGGWLELDTGLASKIESFYIADVAVTALILVASADEKNQPAAAEAFEPPPVVMPPAAVLGKAGSHHERAKSSLGKLVGGKKKPKMEAFEIDLESQDDSLVGKRGRVKVKEGIDKLPFVLRVPAKIARALFKMVIWFLTMAFKCLRVVFGSCYKCLGSKY